MPLQRKKGKNIPLFYSLITLRGIKSIPYREAVISRLNQQGFSGNYSWLIDILVAH